MPPDPPTEAATRLLPPLAAWLLEPPPIQNPGYATVCDSHFGLITLKNYPDETTNDFCIYM